jgi:sugar diacid utilization regulator
LNITKNIFVQELKSYNPRIVQHKNDNPSFSKIVLLGDDESSLSSEHLYVCEIEVLEKYVFDLSDYYFICNGSLEEALNLNERLNCNIICIDDEKIKIGELINRLNTVFFKFLEWNYTLDKIIIRNGSIQNMIEESESFFNNPFYIMDRFFRITGHTKTIPCENEYFCKITEQKELDAATIESLVQRRMLGEKMKFKELTFLAPPNMANCNQWVRSIGFNDFSYASFVMFCFINQLSDADKDIINYFLDKVQELIALDEEKTKIKRYMEDYFIIELIEKHNTSEEGLRKRAKLMNLDYDGKYMLYKIEFDDYSVRSIAFVIDILKTLSSYYRISVYEKSIIILNSMDGQKYDFEVTGVKLSWLEKLLLKYSAYMGMSGKFHGLKYVGDEYLKASSAISIGKELDQSASKRIFWYKDYNIYHMMDMCAEKMNMESLFSRRIIRLVEYDKKNKTDNLNVLKVFLENDRNASQTSKIVQLHRNSILYRIKQIEEILGENLEDANFRLRLILAIYAWEYSEHKAGLCLTSEH